MAGVLSQTNKMTLGCTITNVGFAAATLSPVTEAFARQFGHLPAFSLEPPEDPSSLSNSPDMYKELILQKNKHLRK